MVECFLGYPLARYVLVHHKNEIKWDDRFENFEIMGDSEHARYHAVKKKA